MTSRTASGKKDALARAKREGWAAWVQDDADLQAVGLGMRFSEEHAWRVVEFFSTFLRHAKGQWAGKPFDLLPWQRDEVIAPIFGWIRPDGTRRFRRAFVEVPKKNGKSTMAGGVALYMTIADGEMRAEVRCAGKDREQAKIVWDEAAILARGSPDIASEVDIHDSWSILTHPATMSRLKPLAKENEGADKGKHEGLDLNALIFDEFHVQHGFATFNSLRYAFASRQNPLLFIITTAGEACEGPCWEMHEYAGKVRSGQFVDLEFFGYIRGISKEDDWTTEEAWYKANPSLGETITLDSFRADLQEARNRGGPTEVAFKRYRLNVWGERAERWTPMTEWLEAGRGFFDVEDLEGRECIVGMDLASTIDVAALVALFPPIPDDPVYRLLPWFFVPKESARREGKLKDRDLYHAWVKEGHLIATDGDVIDYDFIEAKLVEIASRFKVREVGYDRWNATQIVTNLMGRGFKMVPVGQGFQSMSPAMKDLEAVIISGKIRHGNHPVMNWMAGNLSAKMDPAGNLKPNRQTSGGKIDGMVALLTAMYRASAPREEEQPSVYLTRGVRTL